LGLKCGTMMKRQVIIYIQAAWLHGSVSGGGMVVLIRLHISSSSSADLSDQLHLSL
jgi:hypothetical protein